MREDGVMDRRSALLLGGVGAMVAVAPGAAAQVSLSGGPMGPVMGPVMGPTVGPAPGQGMVLGGRATPGDVALAADVAALFDQFNRLLRARDREVLGLFSQGDCMVIGPAMGEVFAGQTEIASHLQRLFALPQQISFAWDHQTVHWMGENAAWAWAEGYRVLTALDDSTTKTPYRLTCVLVRQRGAWKIQLFSGSAPEKG